MTIYLFPFPQSMLPSPSRRHPTDVLLPSSWRHQQAFNLGDIRLPLSYESQKQSADMAPKHGLPFVGIVPETYTWQQSAIADQYA